MKRYCCICGIEIKECMGYVKARDFIDYFNKKRNSIREFCGKDIMKLELLALNQKSDLDNYLNNLLKKSL